MCKPRFVYAEKLRDRGVRYPLIIEIFVRYGIIELLLWHGIISRGNRKVKGIQKLKRGFLMLHIKRDTHSRQF